MRIAIFTTFAASRKEPLAEVITRIHGGFIAAGFGEPCVRFTLADAQFGMTKVSSVGRVLKRFPQLGELRRNGLIANVSDSGATVPVDFAILHEIAKGVPRSFPFHAITIHFSAPGFSTGPEPPAVLAPEAMRMLLLARVDIGAGDPTLPGVKVKDSWWVNGRQRHVAAMRFVEAETSAKKLPPPPQAVADVFAACGKVRKTVQVPVVDPPVAQAAISHDSTTREAIRTVVREYRAKLPELLDMLPHDLPHRVEIMREASGPKKPALVAKFGPMGYDCHGGSGTFELQRRTAGNLAVKLMLDVGTWSNSLTAIVQVVGLVDGEGFKAALMLPPAKSAPRGNIGGTDMVGQFPIGGATRWEQIIENLATLVAELDRTFVPAVEAASGPSPAWFNPEAR